MDDPEVRSRYCGYLRTGHGRNESARLVGLRHFEVKRYMAGNPDFAEEVLDAEGEPVDLLLQMAYMRALGDEQREIQPDSQLLMFLLKNLDPDRFGDKKTIKVEHSVDVKSVAELAALRERLERRQLELGTGTVITVDSTLAESEVDSEVPGS